MVVDRPAIARMVGWTKKDDPMLSQKAKYALRALLVLAEAGDDRPVLIGEIAERHNLPKKFLEQILFALTHQVNATVLDRTTLADALKGRPQRPAVPQQEVA